MKVNRVSLKPVEYRVLVLPDPISKYHDKGELIEKSEGDYENDIRLQTRGTIVSLSDVAFDKKEWFGEKPKVGDKIEYQTYSGQKYIENEVTYYIINDKDIIGLIKEQK